MSFQDLKEFNIALLAKQGWRLQTYSNSLFYQVCKAKYFPHGDFLNASLGRNPSYSWRSIMVAQKIVQIGCRWQIGNGDSIGMWSDKWLPISSSYKPATFPHFFPVDAKVSTLINLETATQKSDIIHEVFLPFDAKAVLSIPLNPTLLKDRLIWASTPTGRFSVSSACWVTRTTMADTQQGESLTSQHLASFWRSIWKLPMPNKIKAFTWRACRNILQTKPNLHSWKVTSDSIYEESGEVVESSSHVFWHYARAKEVWLAANVEFGADLGEVSEFLDLVWYAWNVK